MVHTKKIQPIILLALMAVAFSVSYLSMSVSYVFAQNQANLGAITENTRTVVESPGTGSASATQISASSCPDDSVLVGFDLWNQGSNYSAEGSLYCRKITIVATPPGTSVSHSTTFNLTVTESAKPAPTDISVVSACGAGENDREAIISWTPTTGATGYNLYRADDSNFGAFVKITPKEPIVTTSYTDTGLADGGLYSYRVSAVYPSGESTEFVLNEKPIFALNKLNCSTLQSSVSLSCGLSGCIAEYDGSVNLTPIGQGWNSCTTASTPSHTGWDSASWLVSSPAFNPDYVDSTLIAYYKFDDGTAVDSSGKGNNGIINGATVTAGEFDNALSFNGANYVDTKDFSFSKDNSFTFSVWAKTPAFGASQVIFGKPNPNWEYTFMTDGTNAVRFVYWNTTGSRGAIEMYSPSNSFPNNTWTHFVISYNSIAKQAKMYVNGVEKASNNNVSDAFQNRTNNLWIGAGYYAWAQRYFNGSIDDFRIYKDRALSATEVQALYYNDFKASGDKYAAGSLIKNQYTFTFSCDKDGGTMKLFDKADVCVKPPVVQISAEAKDSSTIEVEWSKPTNLDNSFVLSYTLNGETITCGGSTCSKTFYDLDPGTYSYRLITSTPNLCGVGVLESFSDVKSVILSSSSFNLSATPSTIKISAISSAGGSDLISTPSTITITPNNFTSEIALSLISVTKLNPNINIWETFPDINKFVSALPKTIPYNGNLRLTITSKKNDRIPTGKYTLTIQGISGTKADTVEIVLNVGILSFDYREY